MLHQDGRIHPERLDGCRYRQRLAVAVQDLAAGGRNLDLAQKARIALALVERLVADLQFRGAHDKDQGAGTQDEQHQAQAQSQIGLRAPSHRRTTVMFLGSG
jgi:hypothetical protein